MAGFHSPVISLRSTPACLRIDNAVPVVGRDLLAMSSQTFEIELDRLARHDDGFVDVVAIGYASRQCGHGNGIPAIRFLSQEDAVAQRTVRNRRHGCHSFTAALASSIVYHSSWPIKVSSDRAVVYLLVWFGLVNLYLTNVRSAGQPAAASLTGGTYSLQAGYWTGQAKDEGGTLFLPLIVRRNIAPSCAEFAPRL